MQKSRSHFPSAFTILRHSSGFTIVELLVVIVVIGILAALTVVSYTGISQRAIVASMNSDLASAARRLQLYQVENNDDYPTANNCPTPGPTEICLKSSSGNVISNFNIVNVTSPRTFCITITNNNTRYYVTESSEPQAGVCPSTIDSSDTVANWTSSDDTNFTKSQNTTDKQEGTGSVQVIGGSDLLAALPQSANVQGYWKMDEASGNAVDISGKSNTLIDTNTVGASVGKIGNARDFEIDNTEYLTISDATQTGLDITGEITVAAWVKLESYSAVEQHIMSKWDSSAGAKRSYRFYADTPTSKITFVLNGPISTYSAISNDTLSTGTWYHVAATLNQTTDLMQVYINGVANGPTVSNAENIVDSVTGFAIGCWFIPSAQRPFDGLIDEAVIWNKALSAAEVSQLYAITGSSLNDTISTDLGAGSTKNLSGYSSVKFWVKSTRTGSYMQFGIGESAWNNNTTNITINSANVWEQKTMDISGIADANKDAIRYIGFKTTNADTNFTFNFDNIVGN